MTEYYLDIETYSKTAKPDPKKDKIITIQYQELSSREGRPMGELRILTEWKSRSERAMLREFKNKFLTGRDFDFVPIGENLYGFDLISILHRLNKYFNSGLGIDFFRDKPVVDIKPLLVMMNQGRFGGYQRIIGKGELASMVRQWYESKDYERIETYVRKEARNFIGKYQIMKRYLPRMKL